MKFGITIGETNEKKKWLAVKKYGWRAIKQQYNVANL